MLPRRRLRLLLLRAAILLWAAVLLLYLLSFASRQAPVPSHRRRLLKQSVDTVLDNALSHYLIERNSSASLRIKAIQDSIKCFTEQGAWNPETKHVQGFSRLARNVPHYTLKPSCPSSTQTASPITELCSLIVAKSVLFVGSETSFYLHSLWLGALEKHENRSLPCLGQEFCTFHHICRPPLNGSEAPIVEERFKKPPLDRDLIATGSSILRFMLSSSLNVSNDPTDPAYIRPTLDSHTGVRVRNVYWLARARKADIIIMNRGPLPAPAWSYTSDGSGGNWTFVDELYLDHSRAYLEDDGTFATRVINAALYTTLAHFFPNLISSLRRLEADTAISHKKLVWHGSWYLQSRCSATNALKPALLVEDLLPPLTQSPSMIDPWSLYYNAQVYMQNYLLPALLPQHGIIFLPQAITAPTNIDLTTEKDGLGPLNKERKYRKDCLRFPFAGPGGKAMELVFLGGLAKLLKQIV